MPCNHLLVPRLQEQACGGMFEGPDVWGCGCQGQGQIGFGPGLRVKGVCWLRCGGIGCVRELGVCIGLHMFGFLDVDSCVVCVFG